MVIHKVCSTGLTGLNGVTRKSKLSAVTWLQPMQRGRWWIVALMLLINTDVVGRDLFDAPVRGATELVSLSIVGIVFLQLADTLARGRMTRADVLLDRLKHTRPALAAWLQALYHLVGALHFQEQGQ